MGRVLKLYTISNFDGTRIACTKDQPFIQYAGMDPRKRNKYIIITKTTHCQEIKNIFRKRYSSKLCAGKRDMYKMKQTTVNRRLRKIIRKIRTQ